MLHRISHRLYRVERANVREFQKVLDDQGLFVNVPDGSLVFIDGQLATPEVHYSVTDDHLVIDDIDRISRSWILEIVVVWV